jgi:hypothetical protein
MTEPSPEEERAPQQRRLHRDMPWRRSTAADEDREALLAPDPPPPPPRNGGGGRDGDDGRGIDTVMDELLGAGPGPGYEQLGPGSSAVAEAIAGREAAGPVIAGAFWWTVAHSAPFRQAMADAGTTRPVSHRMLVAHADGTRFSLLVLAPGLSPVPRVLPLRVSRSELTVAFDRAAVDVRSGLVARVRDRYPGINRWQLAAAVREVGSRSAADVVICGTPTEVPTAAAVPGVPVPSVPVHVRSTGEYASVGVVVKRGASWGVTTALHAVNGSRDEVYVGGHRGTVVVAHQESDSCLVELDDDPVTGRLAGAGGVVVQDLLPQFGAAFFYRVGEGRVDTAVLSTDLSALDRESPGVTRVYTQPVTRPGDSGLALLDSRDRIAGFAYRRSAFDISVPYSSWIWADQALLALGVMR